MTNSDGSPSSEYLIDSILPKREIHLVAGPSGAGKTRWLFHTLLEWQEGKDVLGCPSYPTPWVYVSADRSKASIARTLATMNIDPRHIPLLPAWDKQTKWADLLTQLERVKAELVVIEAYGSFVRPPANSQAVKEYLMETNRMIQRTGKTVIGIVESPKMKPYEKYEIPRQRVSGAAAWGHFSETIFLVEPSSPKDPKASGRILYVCPRNGPCEMFDLVFDYDGHLLVSRLNEPKER